MFLSHHLQQRHIIFHFPHNHLLLDRQGIKKTNLPVLAKLIYEYDCSKACLLCLPLLTLPRLYRCLLGVSVNLQKGNNNAHERPTTSNEPMLILSKLRCSM